MGDASSALGVSSGSNSASSLGVGSGAQQTLGNFVPMVQGLSAQKEAATAPVYADMQKRLSDDQLDFDKKATSFAPVELTKPPPQPQNDPLRGFASFGALFANIASAFTGRPMINSMNAMAGAINAVKSGDWARYQDEYKKWKDNTELAIQNHKLQAEDMRLAMEKMQSDAATGTAMAHAAAARYEDKIASALLIDGHLDKMASLQLERERVGIEAQNAAIGAQRWHAELMEKMPLLIAGTDVDKANQALQAAAKTRDPVKVAAAQQALDAAQANFYDTRAKMASLGRAPQPGTPAADNAAMQADIKKEHPDWTPGQIALEAEKRKKNVGGSNLTPQALDDAAMYYAKTHQMPATGLGGQAEKDAVANRAAEIMKAAGEEPAAWAANVAAFKAGTGSLNSLTKMADSAKAYENSAKAELDYVASLAKELKLPEPLDSTALTNMVRSGAAKLGDPKAAQFQSALISALDEYAKVLSGGTGSAAASTDSARLQALSLLHPGSTSEQIPALIETLKQGMKYKIEYYDDQIDQIQFRLGGVQQSQQSQQPSGAAQQAPQIPPQTGQADQGAALSVPSDKSQLQVGKKYNTSRGLATWDGTMFWPVTP